MTSGNVCVFRNSVTVHNKYEPETLDRLWNVTREDQACGQTETTKVLRRFRI